MMRASFNLENLFDRAKAFNLDTAAGKAILDKVATLNRLFGKATYSAAVKNAILKNLKDLGVL